jgi:hypothetical protein
VGVSVCVHLVVCICVGFGYVTLCVGVFRVRIECMLVCLSACAPLCANVCMFISTFMVVWELVCGSVHNVYMCSCRRVSAAVCVCVGHAFVGILLREGCMRVRRSAFMCLPM